MSNLKDIVYCSEEQLNIMASGTPVGDHAYDENDLYITPLGDDIIVGAGGSGTKINENNELVVDSTYIKDTVKPDITEAKTIAEKAEVIAKGRATAYIYDTVEALDTDLSNPEFVAKLVKGDNFYIKALDVPDYWWDGTEKQQLETEKPDLSGFITDVQIDDASVVQDRVAKLNIAGYKDQNTIVNTGLVTIPSGYGLGFQWNTKNLIIQDPGTSLISDRDSKWQSTYYALTVRKLDYAVKAAMCDGKGAAWTEEEKIAARERMGINDAITEALAAIGVAEERPY